MRDYRGFRVWDLGFLCLGSGCRFSVSSLGSRIEGLGFGLSALGFEVWAEGFGLGEDEMESGFANIGVRRECMWGLAM